MIAGVIKVHVRDNHVFDLIGVEPDHPQSFSDRTKERPLSFCRTRCIEAGIEYETPFLPDDSPDEIIKRHRAVVRIATDKVM
jgi:hypothetical protein